MIGLFNRVADIATRIACRVSGEPLPMHLIADEHFEEYEHRRRQALTTEERQIEDFGSVEAAEEHEAERRRRAEIQHLGCELIRQGKLPTLGSTNPEDPPMKRREDFETGEAFGHYTKEWYRDRAAEQGVELCPEALDYLSL